MMGHRALQCLQMCTQKWFARTGAIAAMLVLALCAQVRAQGKPPKFPGVDEVRGKVHGDTELETAALQTEVFSTLSWFVRALSKEGEFGRSLTPGEARQARLYSDAEMDSERRGRALYPKSLPKAGPESANAQWLVLRFKQRARAKALVGEQWPELVTMHATRWKAQDERFRQLVAQEASSRPAARVPMTPKQIGTLNLIGRGIGLLMLATSILWMLRTATIGLGTNTAANVPALPAELSEAQLPRLRVGLAARSGQLFEVRGWNEITTTTTTTSGTAHSPGSSSTSMSSVRHTEWWIRYPNGDDRPWRFVGEPPSAALGHVLTSIWVGSEMLLVYNHNTRGWTNYPWVRRRVVGSTAFPWWCVLLLVAAGSALYGFLAHRVGADQLTSRLFYFCVGSLIPLVIVRLAISLPLRRVRNKRFGQLIESQLVPHVESQRAELMSAHTPAGVMYASE